MRGRSHSREFKLLIVRQLASGEKRPAQVCREHNLAASMVARWRQEYDARGEAAFVPPEPTPTQALEAKVADLERFCGQLAMENTVLKKRCSNFRRATAHGD
jgi:transposase